MEGNNTYACTTNYQIPTAKSDMASVSICDHHHLRIGYVRLFFRLDIIELALSMLRGRDMHS